MIVKYDFRVNSEQSLLLYEQQKFMDTSIEAVDGDIVLKFNKFLVEERENEISFSGPQNFIYGFFESVGEGHGSNRSKYVINISSGGTSKVSYPNQGKLLAHEIMAGLAWVFLYSWLLVMICCEMFSLLVQLGSRFMSTEIA